MTSDTHHHSRLHARRARVDRLVRPVTQFMAVESASGVVLLAGALLALAWANSPWAPVYHALRDHHIAVSLGFWTVDEPFHFWVNDVLMVFFFFVVGLEIKREAMIGELSELRRVIVPIAGALGGMIAPAVIFATIVAGGEGAHGWGIPVATDIAFAVGVLTLVGPRVPFGLRVMLLALAIVDDIGGIVVIAVFYASNLEAWALAAVATILIACYVLRQSGVWYLPLYFVLGILGWAAMLESGVHPTIFGVALGLLAPWRAWRPEEGFAERMRLLTERFHRAEETPDDEDEQVTVALELARQTRDHVSPLDRLVRDLTPVVAFGIAPLFALTNSGVPLDPGTLGAAMTSPVAIGVFLGLLVGKPIGIFVAIRLAVAGGARLPDGVGWAGIVAMGIVAGIGFTVALFVTELSYASAGMLTDSKLGVITGSIASGVLGFVALRIVFRHAPEVVDEG
ncbi:MAG: Na+/H+ antiporter NhaA [Dehalococcoidia bacterium]|nr:Na+/H+ antiporter NhaA [Dehalococcoidia bacterium]